MNLNSLFISPEEKIVNALQVLNDTGKGILFAVDKDNKLLGTVTDGDIRRAILKTGCLEAEVSQALNTHPVVVEIGHTLSIPVEFKYDAIPIVSSKGVIVDAIFRGGEKLNRPKSSSLSKYPVVIMAGGLGTRLYPYTKILPKPLIPINDIPISERIIDLFKGLGCQHFFMILNHKKEMIKAYFEDLEKDYDLTFVDEKDFLGTGGGLSLIENFMHSSFILTNCDILIDANFEEAIDLHESNNNVVTFLASLKNFTIPYGTIEIGPGGDILSLSEKPNIPYLVNTGCYIVNPSIFQYIDKGEFIGFPSIVERCLASGENVGVYPISENAWLDMGQLDGLKEMTEKIL